MALGVAGGRSLDRTTNLGAPFDLIDALLTVPGLADDLAFGYGREQPEQLNRLTKRGLSLGLPASQRPALGLIWEGFGFMPAFHADIIDTWAVQMPIATPGPALPPALRLYWN